MDFRFTREQDAKASPKSRIGSVRGSYSGTSSCVSTDTSDGRMRCRESPNILGSDAASGRFQRRQKSEASGKRYREKSGQEVELRIRFLDCTAVVIRKAS